MITNIRGCVKPNDLWPRPISSRSFSHDFVIKMRKYVISCRVRSTACTVLDGFSPYLTLMMTSIRECHTMTFDLDLYLQGYLAVTLPISWIIFIYDTNATHEGTMCQLSFLGQRLRSRRSFEFLRSGQGCPYIYIYGIFLKKFIITSSFLCLTKMIAISRMIYSWISSNIYLIIVIMAAITFGSGNLWNFAVS